MPRYPPLGSTVAKTMNRPASLALVMNTFRPVRLQSPFSRSVARVVIANASLPEPASESAYAPIVSAASAGR